MIPKWLQSILDSADMVPKGETTYRVKRNGRKTLKVTAQVQNDFHPHHNEEAAEDISILLNNLTASAHTGSLDFSLEFRSGMIKKITVKHKSEIYDSKKQPSDS